MRFGRLVDARRSLAEADKRAQEPTIRLVLPTHVAGAAPSRCAQSVEPAASYRRPGMVSRWSTGKDLTWEPLRPELVVQVAYDHMQAKRFRHTAQFRRWRTDKRPTDCTFAQLEVVPPHELASIFATGR